MGAAVVAVVLAGGLLAACDDGRRDVGGAGPGTAHRASPLSGAAPANTVRVDLARSLGPFAFEPGRQVGAVPRSRRHGRTTVDNLDLLRPVRIRVWLDFRDGYDVASRTQRYARVYPYLDAYYSRARTLVVNWQSDYDPIVTGGEMTAAEFVAAQRDMLVHLKRRYPRIQYLEAENEPTDLDAYYPKYAALYRVANGVNAAGVPGKRLEVGGPTLDTFSRRRLGRFLDLYRADRDPAKRLDFLSYHQYLIADTGRWDANKDFPAVVATERAQVDALFAARGMDTRPVLVTETGAFPAARQSNPPRGLDVDLHIQAACLASMHYWYANQRDVVPFDWTIDHPQNDRKDMFVDAASGVPRPYYNAMRMQSMLPAIRYPATSDTLSARGIGVYGLAGASAVRVAVMTWNYQWTYPAAYDSTIAVTHLPAAFRTSNVLVERYKIGKDMHAGDLVKVESAVVRPRPDGTFTTQPQSLLPNELRLLVLTPTTAPVGS